MTADHLDLDLLDLLAKPDGYAVCEGAEVRMIVPRSDVSDHMEFDRQVCAAGLKVYLRPLLPSDLPEPVRHEPIHGRHVLVRELSPDARVRVPVTFISATELN